MAEQRHMYLHVLTHVYGQLTLFLKVAIKMQTRIKLENLKDKTTERKELEASEITNKY